MISHKYAIIMGIAIVCIVLFGRRGINADGTLQLDGKWTHKADNNQVWTYKFKGDDTVHFSIDHQTTKWSVAGIEKSDNTVRIWVDDPGTEVIKVTKLSSDEIIISSRLHCPMKFER